MSKVIFLSFANSAYRPSLYRLKKQLADCPHIDEFHFLTEKDLGQNFLRELHPSLYRRGYGYWKWKSFIAKQQFDRMQDGDILIYSDAGCDYNAKAANKLFEYIEMTRKHISGILCFENEHLERRLTKGDIFDYLVGGENRQQISDSYQRWGGMWMMRKCNNSVCLIDKWFDTCMYHFDLITDKASVTPNFPDFIENRHDQSVFSILTKLHGALALPPQELHKDNYANVPFLPTRHKVKSRWTSVFHKLMIPWRYAVGLYLVYFKHFYFANRIAW